MMSIEGLQDAPRRVIEAWRRYDRDEAKARARYLAGQPRAVDVEAFENAVANLVRQRDGEIAAIRARADHENAADERSIKTRLARDVGVPGDSEINAAWPNRLRPRLDAGFALDEILEAPGLTRADVAAIRSNFEAYLTAKVGPDAARAPSTREQIDEARRRVDAAELGLLGGDVREAVIDARRRDGAERAMTRALAYDQQRRGSPTSAPLDAQQELALGFGLSQDMGIPAHVPGARSWDSIVREIDPEAAARAARDTLPTDARQGLADNARDVGWHSGHDRPVELSGPEAVRRMRR